MPTSKACVIERQLMNCWFFAQSSTYCCFLLENSFSRPFSQKHFFLVSSFMLRVRDCFMDVLILLVILIQ
jgi:hypothetical protein